MFTVLSYMVKTAKYSYFRWPMKVNSGQRVIAFDLVSTLTQIIYVKFNSIKLIVLAVHARTTFGFVVIEVKIHFTSLRLNWR